MGNEKLKFAFLPHGGNVTIVVACRTIKVTVVVVFLPLQLSQGYNASPHPSSVHFTTHLSKFNIMN